MNIIMFIVGAVIFAIFILGVIWEAKTEQKTPSENYEHYGGEGCNQPQVEFDILGNKIKKDKLK